MPILKIKFTKGELKKQRDLLLQFERFLPILQLKKQQLQLEIANHLNLIMEYRMQEKKKTESIKKWVGLLQDPELSGMDISSWLKPKEVITKSKNVAGVELPFLERVDFQVAEYDLFATPFWLDYALEALRALVTLRMEIAILEQGLELLNRELRITTQRLNLFEKVKIPETQEAIRRIKIYIGDQMANAVGRSKLAKRKIIKMAMKGIAL